MNVITRTTEKHQTTCCALCILTANEDSSENEIRYQVERARKEAKEKWNPRDRTSGETLMQCVTITHEVGLVKILKKVGFHKIHKFKRRTGYPEGELTLWAINLI